MKNLHEYLKQNDYIKINFKISKTNHLLLKAKINGISGDFILDTGASNSCISNQDIDHFNLDANDSDTKASGAGSNDITTQTALQNKIKIGRWQDTKFDVIIIDLSHVNQALTDHKAKPIHGIIGADILQKGKAIIDYNEHHLYLSKKKEE